MLRHPTFYQLFCAYMVVTVLVGYGLLMALAWQELSGIDGLLLAMSAFGNAGLTPIDLSRLSAPAVVVLAALNFAGGTILGSVAPVALRRHYIRRTLPPAARAHFTEYCALGKVQALVLTFVATLHLAVFVMLAVWFVATPSAAMLLRASGPSALGFSAYLAVSAVQNTGMALAPDNLTAYFAEWFPLMVVAFGVLAGATLYPVVLRGIVVVLARCTRGHDRTVYRFLLRFPRRCYTHLFPAAETYWLLLVGIALPVLQFALFAALNWNGQAFRSVTCPFVCATPPRRLSAPVPPSLVRFPIPCSPPPCPASPPCPRFSLPIR